MSDLTDAIEAGARVLWQSTATEPWDPTWDEGTDEQHETTRAFVRPFLEAAAPLIEAAARRDERAKVSEEIAEAYARGYGQGRDDEAAGMPLRPAETAVGAISAPPAIGGKHTPSGHATAGDRDDRQEQ